MRRSRIRLLLVATLVLTVMASSGVATSATVRHQFRRPDRTPLSALEVQSLDGRGNNRAHSEWGLAGSPYPRTARPRFADGRSAPVSGPASRYVSNRIFNDTNQSTCSRRMASPSGGSSGASSSTTPSVCATRPAARPTSRSTPRIRWSPSVNTLGVHPVRPVGRGAGHRCHQPAAADQHRQLLHRRVGGVRRHRTTAWSGCARDRSTATMGNNGAKLLMPSDCLLPKRDSRGDAATAPTMAVDGRLRGQPQIAPWSPVTCAPTRTSPCRRRTRCSPGSTTGSWACCRRR